MSGTAPKAALASSQAHACPYSLEGLIPRRAGNGISIRLSSSARILRVPSTIAATPYTNWARSTAPSKTTIGPSVSRRISLEALRHRGVAYEGIGEKDKAIEDFRLILKTAPWDGPAQGELKKLSE